VNSKPHKNDPASPRAAVFQAPQIPSSTVKLPSDPLV